MKILPVEKIREADKYTIKNEPIASIDLMERAATRCYDWLKKKVGRGQRIMVFSGPGNNGGDGLVVARLLGADRFNVEVFIVRFTDKYSDDFSINLRRLREQGIAGIEEINDGDPLPDIDHEDVVIDAIFGSGLSRPVKGVAAEVIRHINRSAAVVVAVDIPSGLYADSPAPEKEGAIIKADHTISFELPKLALMMPGSAAYVGEWHIEPIGLHPDYIGSADTKHYFVTKDLAAEMVRPRAKFSHKGHYGHACLFAGGYGKMGAAVLASKACLHTGAGLLHTHTPKKGYTIIQTAVPEAMVTIDLHDEYLTELPDIGGYNAIAIGPGIGFAKQTMNALKLLIQNSHVPIVFDADAITILGENKTWLSFIPHLSIFTPHPKEFERIAGGWNNDFERLEKQRSFSIKYTCYVVLKGAHTTISCPDGSCFFNSTGNPGMATGGSGDVLTGIILSLLAQGYPPKHAAILGVYLHGLAGDLAAKKHGYEYMIASNMIGMIGKAFKKLR